MAKHVDGWWKWWGALTAVWLLATGKTVWDFYSPGPDHGMADAIGHLINFGIVVVPPALLAAAGVAIRRGYLLLANRSSIG